MTAPPRTPLQVVADHYAAAARGDLAGMLADVADDVVWVEMTGFPYGGTHVGRQAVAERVFGAIAADWSGFGFTPERLLSNAGSVVAIGDYSGTHRASGQSMRVRAVHLWDVADGRVRRFEQFTDTLLVARAMR
jgi:ketosteroid isomerase-like protein